MSYRRNIGSNIITKLVKILIGFVTSIVVARGLGPEGKGYAAYYLLILGMIVNFGHLGIEHATAYFYKKGSFAEQTVFNTNNSYQIVVALVFGILLLYFKKLDLVFQDYSYLMVILGYFFLLISNLQVCTKEFYVGNQRMYQTNRFLLISGLINAVVIMVLYMSRTLTPNSYLISIVGTTAFTSILTWRGCELSKYFKFSLHKELLSQEFRYGLIVYVGALLIFLTYRVDQLMIKNYLGTKDLGIYTVAVTLAELLLLVPLSIKTALMGRLLNTDDLKTSLNISIRTIKYSMYVNTVLIVIGVMMTPLVPLLYGSAFAGAKSIIVVLFLGLFFSSVSKIGGAFLYATNHTKDHLIMTAISFSVNIIGNLLLIPRLGVMGAAYASMFSYMIYGSLYVYYFISHHGVSIQDMLIMGSEDMAIIKTLLKLNSRRMKNDF